MINKKIARNIGILKKARNFLSTKSLITLYISIISPHLEYCNIVWGCNYATRLEPLFLTQKKAMRLIFNADYLAHSAPLFKASKQLNIYDMNRLQLGSFMYNLANSKLPKSMKLILLITMIFALVKILII